MNDLQEVLIEVYDAREKWRFIGLALNLPISSLDGTSLEPDKCLLKMLQTWLQSGKNKTWEALAKAMVAVTVNRPDLEENILKKIPTV